ncbi:hypothetical protein [Leptospira andrefontaineae]|uniref:Capsid protein n=1 Tax=Leptospira andrefontaineae TaxID=2484976 RepID=A0A4R9GXE8_9LEPT|nr:hypothetical protein [Leptospira andrefontaineae]TGK36226.1 hypothetical protein EHO65_18140 [Leptospira andrefontaineae]
MDNALLSKIEENLVKSIQQVYKATGAGVSDAPALIPYALSQRLTNMIQYMNPINELVDATPFKSEGLPGSRKYEYPKQTGFRDPGSFSGEKGQGEYRSSPFDRGEVYIKAKKSRVKVWNLAKKSSEDYIDMVSATWAAEARAFSMDFALGILWDNPILGNPSDKAFGGWENSLDVNIQTNRVSAFTNGVPTKPTNINVFKNAYVRSMRNGGEANKRVWLMTPEMAGYLSDFALDKVRITQDVNAANNSGLPFSTHVGLWPQTLLGIPIRVTTLLGGGYSNPSIDTMGSIILSQAATGGSLANATYYFKVTKIMRKLDVTGNFTGQSMASAPANIVVNGGGSAQKVTIQFAQDKNAIWYRVYACTTGVAADYRLVGVYAARTYNADGDPTGYVTSIDVKTITSDSSGIPSQGVYGKMKDDLPPVADAGVNSESVLLWDLDDLQGMGGFKYLDESPSLETGFTTVKQIQEQGDYVEAMLYSYGTPTMRFEQSSVIINGLKPE